MRKSHLAAETTSSELRRIAEISQAVFGSEDDLIDKVILPFFQVIGYGADSFALQWLACRRLSAIAAYARFAYQSPTRMITRLPSAVRVIVSRVTDTFRG